MQSDITITDVYPLLPAQRGFLVDSLAGEGDQYRQQICVEINSTIPELQRNIQEVVDRNKLLRTVFDWSDGEPAQVVIDGINPVINTFSLSDSDSFFCLLKKEQEALKPVSDAPPLRFAIIERGSKLFLAVTYHHILLDGPSITLLLNQVLTGTYFAEVSVEVYLEWFEQNVGPNEIAVWRDLLAGLSKQDGKLHGDSDPKGMKHYGAKFDATFYEKLLAKAKELHITPAVYMQTLWSEWALAYFGKESLLYGLVMSTRVAGLSDTALGPYISTVPWLVRKNSADMNSAVVETNDKILDVVEAKHIPLGSIAKQTSPLAMSFDAILTITTLPVRDGSQYTILETYENTGYKLSVDIEISDGVSASFATPLEGMKGALESFISYSESQIDSSARLPIHQHYDGVSELGESQVANSENQAELVTALASVLGIPEKDIQITSSFLEMGGDSIVALRLKSFLRSRRLDVSIGDILQAASVQELAAMIQSYTPQRAGAEVNTGGEPIKRAKELLGDTVEGVMSIPPAARIIVNAYRLGYGQDYHEQTAFRLVGSVDQPMLAEAFNKLASEYPTLRLVYPPELPDSQVLTPASRATLEAMESTTQPFEEFVHFASQDHWAKPFDITRGPLLRAITSQADEGNWYFFMSFSALVTDGWSFSTMLERLFEIYGELLGSSYTAKPLDYYTEYSRNFQERAIDHRSLKMVANSSYSSEIIGSDFVVERSLSAKIFGKAEEGHSTVSDTLLQIVSKALREMNFSEIEVYENGRDDPELFSSVGPYGLLSSRNVEPHGQKQAYYVFENYPRESENRLKDGEVEYFKENGNWRRDLLPPVACVGYLFDIVGDTINVRVIVRSNQKEHDSNFYWEALRKAMEEK